MLAVLTEWISHLQVTSPYGNQLYHQENVQSGQFAFTSKESGNHMACFWLQNAPPNVNVNLALDWKTGVSAKDWASIAKKDKLEVQSPILDLQLFFAVTLIFQFSCLAWQLLLCFFGLESQKEQPRTSLFLLNHVTSHAAVRGVSILRAGNGA